MNQEGVKRSALQIIGELDNGLVVASLTEQLFIAHQQAAATQRPAKVQLTLTIKPAIAGTPGVNTGDILQIVAAVDSKLPKPAHDATIFFVTADGNISRNQDRQPALGLRDASSGEVKGPTANPGAAG